MANSDGHKEQQEAAARNDAGAAEREPVVSKPYVMPDDPEPGSAEALAKEAAEAKDRMLRTLAEMENLRKRTQREVADAPPTASPLRARRAGYCRQPAARAGRGSGRGARDRRRAGLKGLIRGRRAYRALAAQGAGEERRAEVLAAGREVRSQRAAGDVRGADPSVPPGTVVQVIQAAT